MFCKRMRTPEQRNGGDCEAACPAFVTRSPGVVAEPKVTPDDVLEQARAGLFGQHHHHVAEHCPHGKEPLRRSAYVVEADVVQEYLLDDEGGHSFGELTPHLHGA